MRIIKLEDHKKYLCPMKDSTLDNNRCDGPKCMWWSYNSVEIYSTTFPSPPKFEVDKTRGYCSK